MMGIEISLFSSLICICEVSHDAQCLDDDVLGHLQDQVADDGHWPLDNFKGSILSDVEV